MNLLVSRAGIGRRSLGSMAGAAFISGTPALASPASVVRIGTQKGGPILMAERQRRGLEAVLNPLGVAVKWVEFPFGPPIMEAIRVGAVDIGYAGDAPPIFAQAAKTDLLYLAAVPASASAILLPAGSDIRTLADLRGKRIAFARGSSAHNLIIAAVEHAGLTLDDIRQAPLVPADAAAAFERGAIDAWSIWDPFYALYETRLGVRTLVTSDGIAPQNSFFLGARGFVENNADLIRTILAELNAVTAWAGANREEVARLVSEGTGVPLEPVTRVMRRYPFQIVPISAEHVRAQQDIADRFHRVGVLPMPINVADAIWHPPGVTRTGG